MDCEFPHLPASGRAREHAQLEETHGTHDSLPIRGQMFRVLGARADECRPGHVYARGEAGNRPGCGQ